MDKRTSATARIVATIVLVAAFVLAIVVISGALGGGGDSNGSGGHGGNGKAFNGGGGSKRDTPATYVVKSGDTLIAIAHENGVSVARIEALNPEVDPQLLSTGEKLKLR